MLLVGDFPRPGDPELHVTVCSSGGDIRLPLRGRVVRIEEEPGGGQIRVGLEFVGLTDETRGKLESLLARCMEAQAPAPLETLPPGAPSHEVRKVLETIPLPHRIALAARAGPREREFLRQDPHPQVLESLVRNPNLLMAEARAIAASPLLAPSTLELLAADPRWARDEELRIAVASHARVSMPVAERIVKELPQPALRKILHRPSTNPAIREKVVRRLARGG